jgi:hypothetical protein
VSAFGRGEWLAIVSAMALWPTAASGSLLVRGLVVPQASGNYTFRISASGLPSEFWLSTDHQEGNKRRLLTAAGTSSAPVALVQGSTYFFEVSGGDASRPVAEIAGWAEISGATNQDVVPGLLSATGPAATSAPSRIINLSINTTLNSAGETFTMGYVVGGAGTSGPKPLVIRAAGPSLATFDLADFLADPKMELFATDSTPSMKTGENNDWGGGETLRVAMAAVGAFAYTGPTSKDSAAALSVVGTSNTVVVSSQATGVGRVLAEVYDATPNDTFTSFTRRLINVSVNKAIGTGLTAGFVIRGSGQRKVLIRAVGPTLGSMFNVPGTMADPQLILQTNAGAITLGSNDNWGGTVELTAAFQSVGAFGLPANSKDAALLLSLPEGNYTVEVKPVAGTATGVGIVEVYEAP